MKLYSSDNHYATGLVTTDLPLMKSVLTPLAKIVLIPFELTVTAPTTDAAIQKKIYGSVTTALIISNEEKEDIIKIFRSLEESGLLIKAISETIKNAAKGQKYRFVSVLLGTLAAGILRKYIIRRMNIKSKWSINKSRSRSLMLLHPLTNFEIQKYCQNLMVFI